MGRTLPPCQSSRPTIDPLVIRATKIPRLLFSHSLHFNKVFPRHLTPQGGRAIVAMSQMTMESKRAGARAFGIILQLLAAVSVLGACIVANAVARSDSSTGVSAGHDRVVWIILAAGLFASCVLAGLGYILGLLCAIYDRQTPGARVEPPGNRGREERPRPLPPIVETTAPATPLKESAAWEFLTRERHVRRPKKD